MLTFAQLHQQCQDAVYEHLAKQIQDPEVVSDLTQDTFIRAYRIWDMIDFETPEQALIALIAIADANAEELCGRKGHYSE